MKKILFTGIGSSYSSCINIARELENKGFNVSLKVASDLVYYEMESITKDTLVVAVSQSGESGEIVSLIERLWNGFPRAYRFALDANEE